MGNPSRVRDGRVSDRIISYNPLYLQVKEALLRRVIGGGYGPGNLIPSEARLAEDFGTSISTVRQALSILVAEGVLTKKQGKGTFVSDRKVEISLLSWIPETRRGEELLADLVARFQDKNPSIQVNVIPTTYTHARDELVRLVSNGNAPDVAQIVSHWTSYFASMGMLEPLESLLDGPGLRDRSQEWDLCGGSYQGSVYSVAWGLCPVSLLVNKNVLEEVGIRDLSATPTLDEFLGHCVRISEHYGNTDKYAYGLNILHDETDFLRLFSFLQSFGGGFVDARGDAVFNSPQNVEAFRWLREFVRRVRILDTDIYTIRRRFAANDVAFITDGPWIKYLLEELTGVPFERNFRVLANPTHRVAESVSWNYNHALAVCSQSRNKVLAARFIDGVTSDYELFAPYFARVGHLPSRLSYMEDSAFADPFFQAFRLQLAHSVCLDSGNPMFEKAMILCKDAVRKILFSDVDVQKELDEKEYYLRMLYYE